MLAFASPPKIPRAPAKTKIDANRPCSKCRYFDNGTCRLFKYSFALNQVHLYASSSDCRSNEDLCGPDGNYFKPNDK